MTDTEPRCPSCNKPMTEHDGIYGTCERLRRLIKAVRGFMREPWLPKEGVMPLLDAVQEAENP